MTTFSAPTADEFSPSLLDTPGAGTTTYTWNGVDKIDFLGTAITADDLTGTSLTDIALQSGGSFSFNFTNGAWSYTTPDDVVSAFNETMNYKLVDGEWQIRIYRYADGKRGVGQ